MMYLNYSDELYHHGIKGQKWGVRRTAEQLGHKIKDRINTPGKYAFDTTSFKNKDGKKFYSTTVNRKVSRLSYHGYAGLTGYGLKSNSDYEYIGKTRDESRYQAKLAEAAAIQRSKGPKDKHQIDLVKSVGADITRRLTNNKSMQDMALKDAMNAKSDKHFNEALGFLNMMHGEEQRLRADAKYFNGEMDWREHNKKYGKIS